MAQNPNIPSSRKMSCVLIIFLVKGCIYPGLIQEGLVTSSVAYQTFYITVSYVVIQYLKLGEHAVNISFLSSLILKCFLVFEFVWSMFAGYAGHWSWWCWCNAAAAERRTSAARWPSNAGQPTSKQVSVPSHSVPTAHGTCTGCSCELLLSRVTYLHKFIVTCTYMYMCVCLLCKTFDDNCI